MTKVYLLWHHDEYGPEGLVATLDKNKVSDICKSLDVKGWFARADAMEEGGEGVMSYLYTALKEDRVGTYKLMRGWGGLHLQIEELI